jgi:hypothetical protein
LVAVSQYLTKNSSLDKTVSSSTERIIFREVDVKPTQPTKTNHTHPNVAADRSTGNRIALAFALAIGLRPYYRQMALRDQRDGYDGSRFGMEGKDLNVEDRHDPITERHIQIGIDVDYYGDVVTTAMMANNQPIVFYTMIPEAAARVGPETRFTFEPDGTLHQYVTGGGEYRHLLWSWCHDAISYSEWFTTKVYAVELRRVSEDRCLVLLSPLAVWYGLPALVARYWYRQEALHRLQVVNSGYARLDIEGPSGHVCSTANAGEFACGTIPKESDSALCSWPL